MKDCVCNATGMCLYHQDTLYDQARNLLAVIHGDGGHYVTEHGLDKAFKDAEARYLALRDEVARRERHDEAVAEASGL